MSPWSQEAPSPFGYSPLRGEKWPHVPQVYGLRARGVLKVDHEREVVGAEGGAESAVTDP
jgi:hypothetical protein